MFKKNCISWPSLFLAPMEGVGDRAFRQAMAVIGGFDEACTEFLRVPLNPHFESLAKGYDPSEIWPIPLAAQIMGSDPVFMAGMSQELVSRGAPRIDLNCGCPSNTVTGHGAGSSLLKNPELLHKVAAQMVSSVSVPVTIKLRSGFHDLSLFRENLIAAESSGVRFLTLHPRTKLEGYAPPARWDLIAEAKSILNIPVVGNGDVHCVSTALKMLKETRCDALMIGRGAVINPWIFREIRCHFLKKPFRKYWSEQVSFLEVFINSLPQEMLLKGRIGKLKQLMGFQFKRTENLLSFRQEMLRKSYESVEDFMFYVLPLLKRDWEMNAISEKISESEEAIPNQTLYLAKEGEEFSLN